MRSSKLYSHKASHAPLINRQLSVCFPLCYFFLSLLFLTDRLYEISSYYNHVQFFCQERKFCDYLYALWELWAGELILTFYTLLRTFHYVDEGISSSFPFIYPRKQTIGFLFNFIYALSGASWLTRGYRHPVLHSHTLPYRFGIFPRVQQAPPASYTLVCSLALRIRTTPCAKVCNNFRLVHDRNVRRKKSLFRMWDF